MAAKTVQAPKQTAQANIPTALDRAIRLPELISITGKSKTSIYADIAAGKFPRGFLIGARARAWSLKAVNSWLDERMSAGGAV